MICMKFLFSITAVLGLTILPLRAEILFKEDFESGPYELDMPIPLDFGVITHGKWERVPPEARPGVIVMDGSDRVLELKAVSGFDRGSRAIGVLGRTNQEGLSTTDKTRFSLRFKISAPLKECYIQFGGAGRARATLQITEDGALSASFAGERKPLGGALEAGKWYRVEITLPPDARSSSQYEVVLLDDKSNAEIDRLSGKLARSIQDGANDYSYFDIQHNTPGEFLLVDDIEVQTFLK